MSVTLLRPACSRADVQQVTRNEDTDNNDAFDKAINLASRWLEERLGRVFWFHDHTSTALVVNRRDVIRNKIYLPFPVITLTELVVSDHDGSNADTWETDEYFFQNSDSGHSAIIQSAGGSSRYHKHLAEGGHFVPYPNNAGVKVSIKGTFGWGTDENNPTVPRSNIPAAVRRAAALIASAFSEENHKQEVGLDGGITELLDSRIPAEAKMLLKPYKLRRRNAF